MPNLTINIPAPLVADLTVIANSLLADRGIVTTGWTATQLGQRFIAELLKDQIVNYRLTTADADAGVLMNTARDAAAANVEAAKTSAATAADGITG